MATSTVSSFKNQPKTFKYPLWDKGKSRKCVCDAQYGDVDCSKRLCPYGTDVLDTKDDTWMGLEQQKHQEQTILFASLSGDFADLAGMTFALTFVSALNETFTTIPIVFSASDDLTDLENDIQAALLGLPQGVIDGVQVKVDFIDSTETSSLVKMNLPDATAEVLWSTGSPDLTLTQDKVTSGTLAVGQIVTGDSDIPPGTTIVALNQDTITLSAQMTGSTVSAIELTFSGTSLYDTGIPRGAYYDGVRGAYVDFSLSKPSGIDRPVLTSEDETFANAANHRRRLANTALVTAKIRFTGPAVQGPQHLLVVEDYSCGKGCTPKLTGLPLETRQTQSIWSTVVEITKSDYNSYECGRRGRCDYTTGLCQCFSGYIGDNCNTLTTLV